MVDNKLRCLIAAMIIFSVSISWGAYAAAVAAFFILFAKNGTFMVNTFVKEKHFILLTVSLVLSTIFSKALKNSLMIDGILILHLMAFIVIVTAIRKESLDEVFKLLNFIGITICIIGIYQYFTGNLAVDDSWTDQKVFGDLVRIYATLRNPNIFAGYLTINIAYATAYLIKKKSDIYVAVNIMLSSVCLILTYSRGGFIAFFAAMVMVMLLCKEVRVAAYLLIMAFIYCSYNSIESMNRINLELLNVDGSSLYRIEIWKASLNLFYQNMIFGSGPGSVMKLLSYSSETLKGFIAHSHNIYLHVLAETGILGLLSFGVLIITWGKRVAAFLISAKGSEYSCFAIGFAASLTALAVHGLVDCVVFVPTRSLIFLIYMSLFPIVYYYISKDHKASNLFQLKGVGYLFKGKCAGQKQSNQIGK